MQKNIMVNLKTSVVLLSILALISSLSMGCQTDNQEGLASPEISKTPMVSEKPSINITPTNFVPPLLLNGHECISSFESFAYSLGEWGEKDLIVPGYPWGVVSNVPNNSGVLSVEVSRINSGNMEIWVSGRSTTAYIPIFEKFRSLQIYAAESKKWITTTTNVAGSDFFVDQLFVTNDGSVWGRNLWDARNEYTQDRISVLSIYNENSHEFELDNGGIDTLLIQGVSGFFDYPFILLGEDGLFWVFIQFDGLYSYNPNTKEVVHQAEFKEYPVTKAAFTQDGDIIFGGDFFNAILRKDELLQFDSESKEIIILDIPTDPWPTSLNLLVDQRNQLWLGAVGWIDSNGEWNLMYPNPEGYFQNISNDNRWGTPTILFESSNGFLWFRRYTYGLEGTAWYDPKLEKGCWFTTGYGKVVEDQYQNMWFVADGKLYTYSLEN